MKKNPGKKYLIKYDLQVEREKFSGEKIWEQGGADALFLCSILRNNDTGDPHAGSKSFACLSIDGRGEDIEMPDTEYFQIFSHLALVVTDLIGCPSWQRKIAIDTAEEIRKHMLARRISRD